jgi:hypothetical protein
LLTVLLNLFFQYGAVKEAEAKFDRETLKAKQKLNKILDKIDSLTPKRTRTQNNLADPDDPDDPEVVDPEHFSVAKKLLFSTPSISKPETPSVFRVVKYNIRDPKQLKFDMQVMKYLATTSLSFNHVSLQGFQEFVKSFDPRLHVKSPRTFSRSKLPLLYKIVKEAVDKKIEADIHHTPGIGLTTDFWSSR